MTNSIHQHRISHSASNPTGSNMTNATNTTNTTNSTTITNHTNPTNLTSVNTNTTTSSGSSAADAASAEDSAVFEISEADFLARVAAFERNEQREAKRANAAMERFLARERARDQSTSSARKSQPPPPSSAVPAISSASVSAVYYNLSGSIPNAGASIITGVPPTNGPAYAVPPGLVDITNGNTNERAYRSNRQRSSNGSSVLPLNNVNTSTLATTTLSTTKRGLPIIQPDSGTVITVQFPATQSIGENYPTRKSKKQQDQDRDQDYKRDVRLTNLTNGSNGTNGANGSTWSNQSELNQARVVACSGPRQFSSPIQGIVESSKKLQVHKVSIISDKYHKSNKDDKENKENMHVLRVHSHRPPAIRLEATGNMLSPTDPASPTTPTTPNERETVSQLSHASQPKLGHTPARLSSLSSPSNEKTTRHTEGVERDSKDSKEAKGKKGLRTSFDVCSTLGLSRKSIATPAAVKAYSESARGYHSTNGNGDYGKGTHRIGGSGSEEDSDEEVYAHPHLHSHLDLHLRGGVHPPLAQRLSKPRCKAQSQSGSLTRILTQAAEHAAYGQYSAVKSKHSEFHIPSYNRTMAPVPVPAPAPHVHVHRISRSVLASSQRVNIPLRA